MIINNLITQIIYEDLYDQFSLISIIPQTLIYKDFLQNIQLELQKNRKKFF